jgi:hypothetical protein
MSSLLGTERAWGETQQQLLNCLAHHAEWHGSNFLSPCPGHGVGVYGELEMESKVKSLPACLRSHYPILMPTWAYPIIHPSKKSLPVCRPETFFLTHVI